MNQDDNEEPKNDLGPWKPEDGELYPGILQDNAKRWLKRKKVRPFRKPVELDQPHESFTEWVKRVGEEAE
jgi:hypothetical protein